MEKLQKSRLKCVAFSQLSSCILFISSAVLKWTITYTADYLQANWIKRYVEWPVFIYDMYKDKQINSIINILQCHMFSWLLHLLAFFKTVDRKRLRWTDVLLIHIIISVYGCIKLFIITSIL